MKKSLARGPLDCDALGSLSASVDRLIFPSAAAGLQPGADLRTVIIKRVEFRVSLPLLSINKTLLEILSVLLRTPLSVLPDVDIVIILPYH